MATMNVSLPDAMKAWVEAQVDGGRYGDASAYVRDLIRRDRARKDAIAALQTAVTDGIESGEPQALDVEAFKLRMRERHLIR